MNSRSVTGRKYGAYGVEGKRKVDCEKRLFGSLFALLRSIFDIMRPTRYQISYLEI